METGIRPGLPRNSSAICDSVRKGAFKDGGYHCGNATRHDRTLAEPGNLIRKSPMLISHRHKFIYLKTIKTGGTSVEIYFEPYCTDPARQTEVMHFRDAESSHWGVVGSRGKQDHPVWYNHAPASRIRKLIGEALWREYYKFCVVRNPYDRIVSFFWFNLTPPVKAIMEAADFAAVRQTFGEWIRLASLPLDRSVYTIDGEMALDCFVRFETLHADHRAGVPTPGDRLAAGTPRPVQERLQDSKRTFQRVLQPGFCRPGAQTVRLGL